MARRFSPEKVREILDLLSTGIRRSEVAHLSGASERYVYGLHSKVGGMYRPTSAIYSKRYLDRDERYEIARLREAGLSLRQIGLRMKRSPSTISRELTRNRDPRSGAYQPERANWLAYKRQRRPKPSLLSQNPKLAAVVQHMLDKRFSPEQVAGRLKYEHPNNPEMHISYETIYRSLFVYPRGGLKKELQAQLRRRGTRRTPRGKKRHRFIPEELSIKHRPEEVNDRLIPGHHEGDLLMGSIASNSAVGTIIERTTGYVTLLHLPEGYTAPKMANAIETQMTALPKWLTKTLTWDRGSEMAYHRQITKNTGIKIYFADPYSPHQRGSNENTNGLLREYLPKSTDLSKYTSRDLEEIAHALNDRPRKRLGFQTPKEALATLINTELKRVATTV